MTKMKLLTSAALFIALFLCATLSRVDAGKSKGKKSIHSTSRNTKSGQKGEGFGSSPIISR